MKEDESKSFDDPALKEAIRRAWSAEIAPAELRRKIAAIAQADPRRTATESQRSSYRWTRWLPMAAAASVLLAVGVVGLQMIRPHTVRQSDLAALPASLASSLVATHDECCSMPDHHMPGLPVNDFKLIGAVLTRRLGWQVLAAAPAGDWNFKGASICMVGQSASGHLVFKRDRQNLSIFSLPLGVVPRTSNGLLFDQTQSGHPIAAFSDHGSLFCLVGSSTDGSLRAENVEQIRNDLKPTVEAASSSARVTLVSSN